LYYIENGDVTDPGELENELMVGEDPEVATIKEGVLRAVLSQPHEEDFVYVRPLFVTITPGNYRRGRPYMMDGGWQNTRYLLSHNPAMKNYFDTITKKYGRFYQVIAAYYLPGDDNDKNPVIFFDTHHDITTKNKPPLRDNTTFGDCDSDDVDKVDVPTVIDRDNNVLVTRPTSKTMVVQCRDPTSPLGGQHFAALMPHGSVNTMDHWLSGASNPFNEHTIFYAKDTITTTNDYGRTHQQQHQQTDEELQAELDEAYALSYGNDDEEEGGDDE